MHAKSIKASAREFLTAIVGDPDEIRRLKRKVNVLIEKLRDERETRAQDELEGHASRAEVARLSEDLHHANFETGRFSVENLELRRESQQKDEVIAKQGEQLFELIKKNDIETVRAELSRERDARENDARQIQKRLRTEFAEQIAGLKAQIASRNVELTAVRAHSAETEILLGHAADQGGGGNVYAVFRLHRLADVVLDLVSAALAADAADEYVWISAL